VSATAKNVSLAIARTARIPIAPDPNCEGSVKARQASAELAFVKSFAVSIKDITPSGTLTSRWSSWVSDRQMISNDWLLNQCGSPTAHSASISLRRNL
jgi:hypothetical protein